MRSFARALDPAGDDSAGVLCIDLSLFFFFQAEDGIRDLIVTGVQTCALPISRRARQTLVQRLERLERDEFRDPGIAELTEVRRGLAREGREQLLMSGGPGQLLGSEERRVGGEGRSPGAADQ